MKIIKFGGKSLSNEQGFQQVISIIKKQHSENQKLAIVVSARGNTTNQLENFLEKAKNKLDFSVDWENFIEEQKAPYPEIDFSQEIKELENIWKGISLLGEYSIKTKDWVLSFGEIFSAKMVSTYLDSIGIDSLFVDSRIWLKTDSNFGNAEVLERESQILAKEYFNSINPRSIPIITGFIGSDINNLTTTLGRNGSNYSASLIANFLNAEKIESYTHVNGIYTTNPDWVETAKIIDYINYQEANEIASFGTAILHPKTIVPIREKNISLEIKNTFYPDQSGTLVGKKIEQKGGIRCITKQENSVLITLSGNGLIRKKGIDGRIFSVLGKNNINIGIISQGSTEKGVSFVVDLLDSEITIKLLKQEFKSEIESKEIDDIFAIEHISILNVVGEGINQFARILDNLQNHGIEILLINNAYNSKNLSLILKSSDSHKALTIIHDQIFGVKKQVNLVLLGKGNVGKALINQIHQSREKIAKKHDVNLNIVGIANSKKLLFNPKGIDNNWENELLRQTDSLNPSHQILEILEKENLTNLIVVDNTASADIVDLYPSFVEKKCHIISSNKIANTLSYPSYKTLRNTLKKHNKKYLYETNVGAGLPIIDTIQLLHKSGENITKIKGVFSGTLSYLFNEFSNSEQSYSSILNKAIDLGYTEPDPRLDLNGLDVARKLLILARELDLQNELDEIEIESLVPDEFKDLSKEEFLSAIPKLDTWAANKKRALKNNEVLRYVAELNCDPTKSKGSLKVSLEAIDENSQLGALTGSDSLFEIYTEAYSDSPISIRGAGAGAEVTARGVFGDILRLVN